MQALNLDADSNLWVTGDHTATKVYTDPAAISDGAVIAATPANKVLMLSTSSNPPVDIHLDTFFNSFAGNPVSSCNFWTLGKDDDAWDTGVVISRDATNMIYVANSGAIGKVPLHNQTSIETTLRIQCECECET